jgi:hypothetical protein
VTSVPIRSRAVTRHHRPKKNLFFSSPIFVYQKRVELNLVGGLVVEVTRNEREGWEWGESETGFSGGRGDKGTGTGGVEARYEKGAWCGGVFTRHR